MVNETYFGLLYALDDLSLYGMLTNTQIKIIVSIMESDLILSDTQVKSVLTRIHSAYINAFCNPFHLARVDEKDSLISPKFEKTLQEIIASWQQRYREMSRVNT